MAGARLALSLQSIRDLLRDLRARGQIPAAVLVSPFDKKDLKFDLMAGSVDAAEDAEATVDVAIAMIEGVPVLSNKQVPRGRAWLLPRDPDIATGKKIRLKPDMLTRESAIELT